ncbi:unnamed protein product [Adineta ricciae]|nr:unnamed protein product [Adineta ricciae]
MSLIAAFSNGTLAQIQQQLVHYGYSSYLVIGVTGCSLNILLLTRRQFRTSSCCTYFKAMSVISLIHLAVALGLYLYTLHFEDPVGTNLTACKLRFYIVQSTAMMYRWCLVIACFDRFALSSTNVRLRSFAQVKVAQRVLPINILVWLVLTIHIPIVYSVRNNICSIFSNISASLYQSVFIATGGFIIPVSVMTICALLIRRNLAIKRQRRQQNTIQGVELQKLQSRRDQQVLIMLFAQMLFYGSTITPLSVMSFYSALTIYNAKNLDRIIRERFLSFLSEMINFLFPVCSFYLYTISSQIFRTELKLMFHSLLRCQWNNTNTRIAPSGNELRNRTVPEPIGSITQGARAKKPGMKKVKSITDTTQQKQQQQQQQEHLM